MHINDLIWLNKVVEQIERKHKVSREEVEEAFYNGLKYRKAQKGKFKGEDLYYAYGRADSGRYLLIVFIYKKTKEALIVSARDMDDKEKSYYGKK